MHSVTDSSYTNVPAFLHKLWKLVEDEVYDVIHWNPNGKSFIIRNQSKFSKELLPIYFKHSNMASFVRQLNMYGFRKAANIENSGLRVGKDEIEFYHPHFLRGEEDQLDQIKRKIVNSRTDEIRIKHEDMGEMISDMKAIKDKQENTETLLNTMQHENEALWREIAIMRQKHQKQQQIVEKLLHFLLSLAHSRGLLGLKRKAGLAMIDESNFNGATPNKIQYISPNESSTNSDDKGISGKDVNVGSNSKMPVKSVSGITIHDVTDVNPIQNSPIVNESSPQTSDALNTLLTTPEVDSDVSKYLNMIDPLQTAIEGSLITPEFVEDTNENNDSVLNTPQPADTSHNLQLDLIPSTKSNTMDNVSNQLEGVGTQIDWLREQLGFGNEELNLGDNTLLGGGLWDPIMSSKLFAGTEIADRNPGEITGNEVAQYKPNVENLNLMDFINQSNEEDDVVTNYLQAYDKAPSSTETASKPPVNTMTDSNTEKELDELNSLLEAANNQN